MSSLKAWKVILLILSSFLCIQFLAAQARIYIDQPQYDLYYDGEASLAVKVEGLTPSQPLRGFQIHLDIDATYLQVAGLSAFSEGSFLSNFGLTQWYVIQADGGYTVTCSILDYTPGATGSGTLFTIDLTAKEQPTGIAGTDVTLSGIILRDPLNHPIPYRTPENSNIVIHPGVRIYIVQPHYDLVYFEEATLEVRIEGLPSAESLRGYQIHFDIDDTYLEFAEPNPIQEGTFLSAVGGTQFYATQANGGYTVTGAILSFTTGAYGAGTLFTVKVKAKDQSTGALGTDALLSGIVLRDPLNHAIVVDTVEYSNILIDPLPLYARIKVFLQGPYLPGGSMRHDITGILPFTSPHNSAHSVTEFPNVLPHFIVDWVQVEVRNAANGASLQAQSGFLLETGSIVDLTGNQVLAFEYTNTDAFYVIVRHRNHLAVMSAQAQTFASVPGTAPLVDLTLLDSIYGGNQLGVRQVESGVLALCAGDADQSESILPADLNDHWRLQSGLSGYYSADFDLDGNVLPNDRNDYWRLNTGLESQIP